MKIWDDYSVPAEELRLFGCRSLIQVKYTNANISGRTPDNISRADLELEQVRLCKKSYTGQETGLHGSWG